VCGLRMFAAKNPKEAHAGAFAGGGHKDRQVR
jgi:hypothetical protein